jgi:hypothetical protein
MQLARYYNPLISMHGNKVGCHDKERSMNSHVHKSGEPANGITRRKVYMVVTNYKLRAKRKCPQSVSSVSSKKRKSFS